MKNYTVTLVHIVGYRGHLGDDPILKYTESIVYAESEKDAIRKATNDDKTHWSVYESYADEAED